MRLELDTITLTKIIDDACKNKIVSFDASLQGNKVVADVLHADDVFNTEMRETYVKTLITSSGKKKSLTFLNKLKQLKEMIGANVTFDSFNLSYDCVSNPSAFKLSYGYSTAWNSNKIPDKEDKDLLEVMADFIKDKQDSQIEGLFIKSSAKKYKQVTWKELYNIIQTDIGLSNFFDQL